MRALLLLFTFYSTCSLAQFGDLSSFNLRHGGDRNGKKIRLSLSCVVNCADDGPVGDYGGGDDEGSGKDDGKGGEPVVSDPDDGPAPSPPAPPALEENPPGGDIPQTTAPPPPASYPVHGGGQFPQITVRTIDGTDRADGLGAAETPLMRLATAVNYMDADGQMMPGPNPRDVSNTLTSQSAPRLNALGKSDMLWQFGQFLDHDIDLTEASNAFGTAPVSITDPGDPFVGTCTEMEFSRSEFAGSPRQQLNHLTAFIDGSGVYGSDNTTARSLRTWSGGLMNTTQNGRMPPLGCDGYCTGDPRGNEQVGLTAMHSLFVREHNRLARRIQRQWPNASDEQIYQLARKLVGATIQKITYEEFLPSLLGPCVPSPGGSFNPAINPSVSNEFSTFAFRVGHTMLSSNFALVNETARYGSVALRDAFFRPEFFANNAVGVDHLIGGFIGQRCQEVDTLVIDDVRHFLFDMDCLDLVSLNIQRGRDHGMMHYNSIRKELGVSRIDTFAGVTSDTQVQRQLALLYSSPSDMDAWVGGLAEDHTCGMVGELIGCVLKDQFERLRDGDPYFYKWDSDLNLPQLNAFWNVSQVSLAKVIRDNTIHNISPTADVFSVFAVSKSA